MPFRIGITGKLCLWYFLLISIFYVTMGTLYVDVRRMMDVSDAIVSIHVPIVDTAKQMPDLLLAMEENEQKFRLLKKEDYRRLFLAAKGEFESKLEENIRLEGDGPGAAVWREILHNLRESLATPAREGEDFLAGAQPLIPEALSSRWIEAIARQRMRNEQETIRKNRELNRRGRSALRKGLVGLSLSVGIGLAGILVLSGSMVRPLAKLRQGIRAIARERDSGPVQIRSGDEFGELAEAFNDMARRLKEEEKMRADFIAALSHEIRTPLTSIRESVNLLAEEVMGPTNPRQRKFLAIASDEIGRICDLLNRLMQVSRLESAALELALEPMDMYALLAECSEKLQPAATAKAIGVHLEVPPWTPKILGDPRYLPLVVLNLLGNAIKFSKPRSAVHLKVAPESDRRKLRFLVMDNGPGIAQEEVGLIFNQYYRAQSVREEMDGAGLGLSIARRIVEAHAGQIGVQSTQGVGSCFYFTLQRADLKPGEPRAAEKGGPAVRPRSRHAA